MLNELQDGALRRRDGECLAEWEYPASPKILYSR